MGIIIASKLQSWTTKDLMPLINALKSKLANWAKLKLSGFGRIAAIKLKFLFLFQNISFKPQHVLNRIHTVLNNFIWGEQKPRMEMSIMQPSVKNRGLALQSLTLYCNAAMLTAIAQW